MFQSPLTDRPKVQAQTLAEKLNVALLSGGVIEFTAEEAAQVGAFCEDALSEQDAAESNLDSLDAPQLVTDPADSDPKRRGGLT